MTDPCLLHCAQQQQVRGLLATSGSLVVRLARPVVDRTLSAARSLLHEVETLTSRWEDRGFRPFGWFCAVVRKAEVVRCVLRWLSHGCSAKLSLLTITCLEPLVHEVETLTSRWKDGSMHQQSLSCA
jgi:hypothetical protein